MVEEKIESDGLKYCSLYLAEPAFGTKLFDHENTMKGLALALKLNGHSEEIGRVIVQGGVIPHVPPYTSKSYLNDLKLLDFIKVNPGEEKTPSDFLLEERLMTPYEKEYYHTKVHTGEKRKIDNLEDAFEVSGQQLGILMEVLPKETPLKIQTGEEDRKNIGYIERAKTEEAAEKRSEQLKGVFEGILNKKLELTEELKESRIKKYVLSRVNENGNFKPLENESRDLYYLRMEDSLKQGVSGIVREFSPENKMNSKERDNLLKGAIKTVKWAQERGILEEKLIEYEENILRLKIKDKNLKNKALSVDRNIKWSENLLKEGFNKSVSFFTGQLPITPGESEIYWASAKEFYTKKFQEWDHIKQPILVHVSARKNFDSGDITTMDSETGKKKNAPEKKGKKIMMTHNIKTAFSDAVSARSIKEGKAHLNFGNTVLNKKGIKEESPDYVLLGGHDGGGFRVMPWFKESERPEEGVFVKNQEISYLISLPTLQDVKKLEWAVDHNFSGWHIKNYLQGPSGSASIIHTEDQDGVNGFEIWDTQKLIEWGEISKQIKDYKKSLENKKINSKEKRKLNKEIKNLEGKVKINFIKLETAGDYHFGVPANKDRYSTDQLVEAAQIYQRENGLPDTVCWDEIPNGLQAFHGAESEYQGDISPLFKQKLEEIESKKRMSYKTKCDLIIRASLTNQRAIPVFNDAEQKKYFKYVLKPYADEILEKGGKLILMSGNHHNKSQRRSDEATSLGNQFSNEQVESKQVEIFEGKANDVGLGLITLPGGQRLYACHKFPRKMDEIYGMMTYLRSMNNDADVVFGGDAHQTGAGYADGHVVTIHPGLQSMNNFVASIGKPAGLRGIQNVYYDPEKPGIYKVKFVLNNTLEKIIEEENIR